jgi:hypothetical protein
VSDYLVQYRPVRARRWVPFADEVRSTTRTTITGLSPKTRYVVRVRARSAAGAGKWSEPGSGRTWSIPSRIRRPVAKVDRHVVSVSWLRPRSSGDRRINDYIVQLSKDGSAWSRVTDGIRTETRVRLTGLHKNTSYRIRVAAVSRAGVGKFVKVKVRTR